MNPVSRDLNSGLLQLSSHVAQLAFRMAKSTWKFLGGRLQEPEEHSSVRIYGLCNMVEQGEQHKGQPTAKLLAFCMAHKFSSLLDLLL